MAYERDSDSERLIAAVDLGSNSFYLAVARITSSGLQVLKKERKHVYLASGLDHNDRLDEKSIFRGLKALEKFEIYLSDVATENICAVATHTLRQAKNANLFLDRALAKFRAPVKIISGNEEADFIYKAVVNALSTNHRLMVFDIGGGSTEFAVGSGDQTNFLSSVILGCNTCSYLFAHQITWIAFSHAELIVRKAIRVVIKDLKSIRFDNCIGTSGTAKDISELGEYLGFGPVITKESIEQCKRYLVEGNHFKSDNYFGLTVEPKSTLSAGLAIFATIMSELQLPEVHYVDAALREGILYNMYNSRVAEP
jgi:exopolyphosphatase/guanosine-5'-triphosphate,3'-diphosphate pyrophosphatase